MLSGGGGGGVAGSLAIAIWVTTTTLGLLVFAWTIRRPHRDKESPLAAALSMVAAAHTGFRRDVVDQPAEARPGSAATASGPDPTAEAWLPLGPDTARLSNRPTGWQSRPALTFEAPPARDAVRRRITYRLVRLSDGPDDVRSSEIMRLDRGDEIEIVGQEGTFIQVRTPTGEIGWIPSVTIIG